MRLTDLVTPKTIILDIRAGTKPEVLAELAGRAACLTRLDRMDIFRALLDQEASVPTGLGLGVAIPHARFAALTSPAALFAKLGRPIDFHALDQRPVDILFVLLGPDPATAAYLKLLLSASRALRDPVVRDALREKFDVLSILAALQDNAVHASP
jgi:PTS system nitrogen regulatory IIA component